MNNQEKDNNKSLDESMEGNNGYSLYTEKIVKNPWNKGRKMVKNIAKVIGSAVLFGVVAGLIIFAVLYVGKPFLDRPEDENKANITIPTDTAIFDYTDNETEFTSEEYFSSGSEDNISLGEGILPIEDLTKLMDDRIKFGLSKYRPGIVELESVYFQLRTKITDFRQAVVAIRTTDDLENIDFITQKGFFGFIVAEDDKHFYILTHHEANEGIYYAGFFYDGSVAVLDYIGEDHTTGIVVYSADKSYFSNLEAGAVRVATLGNSYTIQQGQNLVAFGSILGEPDMLVFTNACATNNTLMATDCNYRVINTDISYSEGDKGVLLNTAGEVVGIIITDYSGSNSQVLNAYAISELKPLLEHLINGKVTPYVGVLPQTVNTAMKNVYNMPAGIYVHNVIQDSPAYREGIQNGDVITMVNGIVIGTVKDYQDALFLTNVGDEITFAISRPSKDGYREIEIKMNLIGQ